MNDKFWNRSCLNFLIFHDLTHWHAITIQHMHSLFHIYLLINIQVYNAFYDIFLFKLLISNHRCYSPQDSWLFFSRLHVCLSVSQPCVTANTHAPLAVEECHKNSSVSSSNITTFRKLIRLSRLLCQMQNI